MSRDCTTVSPGCTIRTYCDSLDLTQSSKNCREQDSSPRSTSANYTYASVSALGFCMPLDICTSYISLTGVLPNSDMTSSVSKSHVSICSDRTFDKLTPRPLMTCIETIERIQKRMKLTDEHRHNLDKVKCLN